MIEYGSIYNMALISFATGFAATSIYQNKKEKVNFKNKILGGSTLCIVCSSLHIILKLG